MPSDKDTKGRGKRPEPSATKRRHHFLRFLGYVRPYWKYILLAAVGGVVKFTIPLFVPQVIQHLLDNVLLNEALHPDRQLREAYYWLGGMALLFIFFWAPWVYVRHYFAPRAGQLSVFDLRCDLYQCVLRMSRSFFSTNRTGEILSRLTSDVALTQNLVGNALTNVWMDATAIVVILGFMLRIDATATLMALCTMPLYLVLFKKFGGRIKEKTREVQDETAKLSGNAQEKLAGSQVVHAFAQEPNEERRFSEDGMRLYDVNMQRAFWQSMNQMCVETLVHVLPLAVTAYTTYATVKGPLTIGQLVAFNMYLGPLYLPMRRFADLNVIFANATAALDRIFEFMDEESEVQDQPDAFEAGSIEGRVEFDKVWFSYGVEDAPVLEDVSFTVEPGQNVALVGPSGAGKSTVASLIPRFYDVDQGAIRVDGRPIQEYQVRSLRQRIGMVLQDPILFSGTIRENILYGRPDASDEALVQACDAANALEFIEKLPKRLDTEVGERGVMLSGGQKQRLTIARAFLADPRILILDEATSSLDSESELLIQQALNKLIRGRTTFTIAHRLSTVIHADRIIVLLNGRIVEAGTHTALLERGEVYRNLYERQFAHARELDPGIAG